MTGPDQHAPPATAVEGWQGRLRASGRRLTAQRELILQTVNRLGHATPEEVHAALRNEAQSGAARPVNVSTVYRTLELLEGLGLVRHAHLSDRAPTYHSVLTPDHIHLVCRPCGALIEASQADVAPLVTTLAEHHSFTVDVGHLTVFGACADCSSDSREAMRSPAPLDAVTLPDLRTRTSVKWREYDEDVLPLWVAEMDVAPAPAVVDAVTDAMRRGDTGYAVSGTYATALADFAAARWEWEIDTSTVALVPDVMIGIVEVLRLVTHPGDAAIVNSPVYPPFYQFLTSMGLVVHEAPLDEAYRIDLVRLEQTFAALRPAAYLLCSPHNPTGTVHTVAELEAVGGLADEYGVRVVVDEIHAPLVYAGSRHVPYLSLPSSQAGFAVLSASKAWNLAGLKTAAAVAGTLAVDDLRAMPEEVWHGASHLGVLAQSAAFRSGVEWLDAVVAGLDRNRRLLAEALALHLPEVRFQPPEGTYLAWLDCRPLGLAEDPAQVFLEKGRVALNSGPTFGTGGQGHVRLNFATSPAILEEAVRRMAASVRDGRAE